MNELLHDICESMSDDAIEAIVEHIASKTDFGVVENVSNSAWRLAEALGEYAVFDAPFLYLVVDDVCTTGASLEHWKSQQSPLIHPDDIVGWVIFNQGKLPDWANAVFMV